MSRRLRIGVEIDVDADIGGHAGIVWRFGGLAREGGGEGGGGGGEGEEVVDH